MLLTSGIDGRSLTLLLIVPVDNISPWSICCHALLVVFHLSAITKFVTSLLHCYLRSATNVKIEPRSQPLTGEHFPLRTANCEQNACLDVVANDVCEEGSNTHSLMFACLIHLLSQIWTPHSLLLIDDMRMINEQRIIQVEHSSFVPLVFSATGGMSRSTSNFHCHLALKLSVKHDEHLSVTLGVLRCRLSFALLWSATMCIRGIHSSRHKPILHSPFDLQVAESRLSFCWPLLLLLLFLSLLMFLFVVYYHYCGCHFCCCWCIIIFIVIII